MTPLSNVPPDCRLPECPYLEDKKTVWVERAKLAGVALTVLSFIVGGAISFQQARIEAANVQQTDQIRREFVAKEQYEADRKAEAYLRDQLDKRLERMDKKLDQLIERRGK